MLSSVASTFDWKEATVCFRQPFLALERECEKWTAAHDASVRLGKRALIAGFNFSGTSRFLLTVTILERLVNRHSSE